MKRFFSLLLLLPFMVCANAQVWYYVDSKTDITTSTSSRPLNKHYTIVLVRDNSGTLWMEWEFGDDSLDAVKKMKDAFTLNPDFYVNAFNNSEHGTKPGSSLRDWVTDYNSPRSYKDNRLGGTGGWRNYFRFVKLKHIESLQKCKVYEYNQGAKFRVAISHDYKTVITDPDSSSPCYFTSYSPEDFITHKSADDLF